MNHMIHIKAISQLRLDTDGQASPNAAPPQGQPKRAAAR